MHKDSPVPVSPLPMPETVWAVTAATMAAVIAASLILPAGSHLTLFAANMLMVAPAYLALRGKGYRWRTVFRLQPAPLRMMASGAAIGAALCVLNTAIDAGVQTVWPMPDAWRQSMAQWMAADSTADMVTGFAGLVILSSVCEELFFRGFLQTALEWWYPRGMAVIVTCALFGIAHVNPWWLPSILFMGLILGVVAFTGESVYPGMMAHAVNNACSLILASLGSKQEMLFRENLLERPLAVAAAAVILSVALIYFIKRKLA